MKKLLAIIMAAAMSAVLLTACSGGTNPGAATTPDPAPATTEPQVESTAPVEETEPAASGELVTVEEGKLIMSTNAAFPPYEMTTDDGSFEGIDVEVAGAIAEKLGLELEIMDVAFNAALTAVQTGQSDIAMAGITVNPERQEAMDFSDSYATGVQVVIVKEDSTIQSIDDLANAEMIGCQADTTGYIYCSDTPENGGYGEDHVTAYDTGALAVMALVTGQVDAVVIDNEPAKAFVEQNEGLKILDTEFAVEDYAIAVAKGNTALLDAINTGSTKKRGDLWYNVGRYVYVPLAVILCCVALFMHVAF